MKKYIIYSFALLFTSGLFAQGIYNNGAKITVGSGSYLTIGGTSGNYRNEYSGTNGSLDLAGTLALSGNVINNVANGDVLGSFTTGSVLVLNGVTAQSIGGTTSTDFILPGLTVNNLNGINLTKNVRVNGNLTLTSGIVDIGNNNFTFGPSSIVLGTPSETNMFVASGNGQFKKIWSAIGTFTFPIGDNNITTKYSPVTLTFNSGTFGNEAVTSLNIVNAKYNDPFILSSYLNRYWNLSQSGITAFNCNAVFQYQPSDVVGTESLIKSLKVTTSPFEIHNNANSTLHQLSATGLTSLSTFTGGTTDYKTLNLSSVMLEGLYIGVNNMFQAHDNTGTHWPSGIADYITVELHDASAYSSIIYSTTIPLSTTGTANIPTPLDFSANYYVTIKHRNSLETTTSNAISFANSTINKSFGTPAEVFGGNLKLMPDNGYAIKSGDLNQDGVVNTTDRGVLLSDLNTAILGYNITDINGDGAVNTTDRGLLLTNLNSAAIKLLPLN